MRRLNVEPRWTSLVHMIMVNIHAAKTQFSKLVDQAAAGEEIIIAKAGKPVAKLAPLSPEQKPRRRLGSLAGQITISDDFDAPLPDDIIALFEGGD